MNDEQEEKEINVFQSNRFDKKMKKLPEKQCELIEDEIDKIIDDPKIGTQKKGDLSHVWVHKFKMDMQEVLIGYSWVEDKLELYLLNIGSHENYYNELKKGRKSDLKFIG